MEPGRQTDRFQAANDIFAAALGIARAERTSFVRARCAGEATLEQSVLRLLAKFDELGDFLEEPAWVPATELQPGDLPAGRFRIMRKLGAGGMGEVYQAEDLVLGETVAIKSIRSDFRERAEVEARFRDEIRLARRIAHPNVCRAFDVFSGERNGEPFLFFTMEFLDGQTLAAKLADGGPLAAAEALEIAGGVAAGLDAAHREGVIHRDLKPANIMLAESAGGGRRTVITDFGLARTFTAGTAGGLTRTGQILGSPHYMAPEQFLGSDMSAAADIYAFGTIFYEMVAGRRPYADENLVAAAIRRSTVDAPALSSVLPGCPPGWDRALARALSRNPAHRPASAGELLTELRRSGPRMRYPSRRFVLIAGAGIGAVASSAAILRFYPWRQPRLPAAPTLMFVNASSPGVETQSAAAFVVLVERQLDPTRAAVLGRDRMAEAWSRMHGGGTALPEPLPPREAREVALRGGANLVVFSGATRKLDEWSFWLRVELLGSTPAAPAAFWEHEFRTAVTGDRFAASTDAARWLGDTLGAAPAAGVRARTPQELTTSNWEALVEYTEANDAWARGDRDGTERHLKTALDLDPEFPLAATRMADILTSSGRIDDGLSYYARASELVRRKNLTDRESLRMRTIFALDTAQWSVAEEAAARWAMAYPEDVTPLIHRGRALERLGRIEESVHVLDLAVTRSPESRPALSGRAVVLLRAGRFDEFARDCARLGAIVPVNSAYQLSSALAAARNDFAGAWQALESMLHTSAPSARSTAYGLQACFRAEQGRLAEAGSILEAGIQFDRENALSGAEIRKRRLLGQLLIHEGNLPAAREQCRIALASRPGHAAAMEFGCLLARAADIAGARATIPRDLPELPVYGHWLARVRGEIALATGDFGRALATFAAAPDNPTSGTWPEYLVRAAAAAGDREVVGRWVSALAANPARYWFNADLTAPGFLTWALQKFAGDIDSKLKARAAAFVQSLIHLN
jgi:tetratricopeptide (TPR) repeat protein